MLEWIINFIKSLFGKSGRKPPKSAKPAEATGEVLVRLKETKEAPAAPPQPEKIPPLKIRSERDWNDYAEKLCSLDKLNRFVDKNFADYNWFAKSLDRVKKDISKMVPTEFDEYTTENIVSATVNMSRRFLATLDSCGRTINNPSKDSTAAQELSKLIAEYLAGIGIRPMNFKPGDDYGEWADLGMSELPLTEKTTDRSKRNTLKEIKVQPHFIYYIDEYDKEARRVFGGQCVAYAFQG